MNNTIFTEKYHLSENWVENPVLLGRPCVKILKYSTEL